MISTYEIRLRTPVITVQAKNKQEVIELFWEEFDTYCEGYPDEEDVIIKRIKN